MTTSGADIDEHFVKMITFLFQWHRKILDQVELTPPDAKWKTYCQ